ncbi:T9SS type A sorting domain-containing protein [Flavobacterium oreochromis]|uniref:Secretion protein n=2 Tax=Flavobacterium TaxID=237 RepID=A0A246GBL3_9FLAO|nr:T9SS type A sorting domain-containing protein [Flavobacterium oreochromis]OWP77236.1 secretion protein [Flavobacterium oreochromis]OWP78116.1 secretion protein [Flavobacterium oreochromis]POR28790.1 secretion protein [Flavobacterium columnare]QYS87418.1 T9SS type A sorting domain-containing protein [Flavobacterium oreochromis]
MKKNYLSSIFISTLFALVLQAQDSKDVPYGGKFQEQPLDNLTIYPNPSSTGRIYITSRSSSTKEIEVYDVLGKLVLQTLLTSKELNITSLNEGVYIIKIKEGEQRITRKLIVK